ncbi:phosphatase PAP2 family protein [Candidatus Deferrimicrobium sp.]|uniref:phosphatase PAP2 family protein n=1 Tax=Candidatus Deferrimicrobium sp. TaxID=3060586 RepID=UPI0027163A25|nr:phosphatase PAP2 family protein [Candidatus Deferrimicrobium sp.]MDO8738564.1 phosphatase PAP2 family protein [Candidatus Deferrimicrobium sp.]
MTLFLRIVLGLAVLLLPLGHRCLAEDNGAISRGYKTVKTDFGNYYLGRENLTMLGVGVAGAAVFANTNMDMYIRNKYQDDLRSHETDKAMKIFNISAASIAFVIAPAYLGAYGAGKLLNNATLVDWAENSFRATVVGGPALLLLAAATGADRPAEGDSNWGAFNNFHGVSGHAYFSAVPFITAAKMSENPYQKAVLYGLSTFTGIGRINDDRHYFSQVALGWFLAYLSCDVVEKGNVRQEGRVDVQFAAVPKGIAVTFQKRY